MNGNTPLLAAAAQGARDVCKLLLDKGATVDNSNRVCLTGQCIESGYQTLRLSIIWHKFSLEQGLELLYPKEFCDLRDTHRIATLPS